MTAILAKKLAVLADQWAMVADFAPTRPDADAVLAVARVLAALREAFDRGENDVLLGMGDAARLYLGSVTVDHPWGTTSIGRDVLRGSRLESLVWLRETMGRYLQKGVPPNEMAEHFLGFLIRFGDPLAREIAQLEIQIADPDRHRPRRDVVDKVSLSLATAIGRIDRADFEGDDELAKEALLDAGKKLVAVGLSAIGYPTKGLYDAERKRETRRRAAKS